MKHTNQKKKNQFNLIIKNKCFCDTNRPYIYAAKQKQQFCFIAFSFICTAPLTIDMDTKQLERKIHTSGYKFETYEFITSNISNKQGCADSSPSKTTQGRNIKRKQT